MSPILVGKSVHSASGGPIYVGFEAVTDYRRVWDDRCMPDWKCRGCCFIDSGWTFWGVNEGQPRAGRLVLRLVSEGTVRIWRGQPLSGKYEYGKQHEHD